METQLVLTGRDLIEIISFYASRFTRTNRLRAWWFLVCAALLVAADDNRHSLGSLHSADDCSVIDGTVALVYRTLVW